MSGISILDVRLTADQRYSTCVHEAAHAIVALFGGEFVEEIAVLPEGATPKNVFRGRQHDTHGAKGVCRVHFAIEIALFVIRKWDDEESRYIVDPAARGDIRDYYEQCGLKHKRNKWQRIRAALCCHLAGPIADLIQDGEKVEPDEPDYEFDGEFERAADICKALAIAEALPGGFNREFDSAWKQTVTLLKDPDVWSHVVRLADELKHRGEIGYSWPDNFLGLSADDITCPGSRRKFPRPPQRAKQRTRAQPQMI